MGGLFGTQTGEHSLALSVEPERVVSMQEHDSCLMFGDRRCRSKLEMSSRTVRIFLSSTFRDLAEERALLVKKVVSAVCRRLKARFVDAISNTLSNLHTRG